MITHSQAAWGFVPSPRNLFWHKDLKRPSFPCLERMGQGEISSLAAGMLGPHPPLGTGTGAGTHQVSLYFQVLLWCLISPGHPDLSS